MKPLILLKETLLPLNFWSLGIVATLVLMPLVGSLGSAFILIMSIVAWKTHYFCNTPARFTRPEKWAATIIFFYFFWVFFCSITRVDSFSDFSLLFNNIGLVMGLSLLFAFRLEIDETWLDKIVVATGIAGIVLAMATLLFTIADISDPDNFELFSGNSLILAYLAGYNVVFGFIFFLKHDKFSWLSLLGSIGSMFTLTIAARRGPMIAVLLALLPVLILTIRSNFRKVSLLLMCVVVFGGIALSITAQGKSAFSSFGVNQLIERLNDPLNGNVEERSIFFRFSMYRDGWEAFKQAPLLGHGRQNTLKATVAAAKANDRSAAYSQYQFSHLHNAFLTEAVSAGILGIAGLLGMYLIPVFLTWRGPTIIRVMGISYSIYLFCYGLTNIGFYHDVTVFSYIFIVAILNALAARNDQRSVSTD